MGYLHWGSRRLWELQAQACVQREGIPREKGFPCLCVPDNCSCTAVLLCKLLGTPGCRTDAGALAWRNYKLLVTKREKIFFSAQLR